MAKFLYRLGLFSANRAWLVILSWLVILGSVSAWAVAAGGSFTTTMSVPGTPAQNTIDQLKTSFPKASRGSGQVVFVTQNGHQFTAKQKRAISSELHKVATLDSVASTLDPFKTQQQIDASATKLHDGADKLAKAPAAMTAAQQKLNRGVAKLASAQASLNAAAAKLAAAQTSLKLQAAKLSSGIAQLTGAIAQAKADGAPDSQVAALQTQLDQLVAGKTQLVAGQAAIDKNKLQLVAGQKSINAGLAKLKAGQTALDKAKAKLPAQTSQLATGKTLLEAASGFRTVSKDGSTAVGDIFFNKQLSQITTQQKDNVVAQLTSAKISGVQIEVSQDLTNSPPSVFGIGEALGVVIAGIVLFLMLGTLIGAGLPIISAVLGVGIAAMATVALSAYTSMGSTTLSLGGMLGLAVGIDYALFIINRHRRQLKAGMQVVDSIALATGTSGSAVLFAGLTVIIALAALNLTGIGFLGLMGTVGAAAIAVAVLVAVSFTPAFLSLLKLRILSKRERKALGLFDEAHPNVPERVSTLPVFASKHPLLTLVSTIVILFMLALPISSLRLGLPDGSSENTNSTQYKAYKLVSKAFGVGMNGPLAVVVTSQNSYTGQNELNFEAKVVTKLMSLKNVDATVFGGRSSDKKTYLFQVLPKGGPTSVATETLVRDIRAANASFTKTNNASIQVTGLAAVNIDISQKLSDALPLYLGTVLILSLILLTMVFRSIAVPLVASAGFLLSVFAVLGSVTAVFQWGWLGTIFDVHDPGPILAFLPTMVIGILFGLAMDYQLFLVSGMREAYVHGKNAKDSINYGIHLSRQVVVAAAIIMVSVFGSFAFSEQVMLRAIGFGLAMGVLLDAFLVRLMFVPAVMTLLGSKAWWIPKWLDKVLPNLDVEGAQLDRNANWTH